MFEFTSQNQQLGNEQGGILEVVGGFDLFSGEKWAFPGEMPKTLGTDGCVGKTTVSQYVKLARPQGAQKDLVIHVTFNIKEAFVAAASARDKVLLVRLALSNLHYTARPEDVQLTISDDGYSILAAGASVHRGAFSKWNHNDDSKKLQALAEGLGMGLGAGLPAVQNAINAVLTPFDANSVVTLGQLIVDTLHTRIINRIQRTKTYQDSRDGLTAKSVIVTQNFSVKDQTVHERTN